MTLVGNAFRLVHDILLVPIGNVRSESSKETEKAYSLVRTVSVSRPKLL